LDDVLSGIHSLVADGGDLVGLIQLDVGLDDFDGVDEGSDGSSDGGDGDFVESLLVE